MARKAIISLTIDPELLEFCKSEARKHHTNLSRYVSKVLYSEYDAWLESDEGLNQVVNITKSAQEIKKAFKERYGFDPSEVNDWTHVDDELPENVKYSPSTGMYKF